MSRMPAARLLRCTFLLAVATPFAAVAHPGHGLDHALGQGILHPLTGLDHLLALLAVGLWAAQRGGTARWALPMGFLGLMTAGAFVGQSGIALPGTESVILASVLVLGLAVATARRAPLAVSGALTALFAMAHGYAHGSEMVSGAARGLYTGGFLAASALLMAAGLGGGILAARCRGERWLRWAGVGIAAGGLLCLAA